MSYKEKIVFIFSVLLLSKINKNVLLPLSTQLKLFGKNVRLFWRFKSAPKRLDIDSIARRYFNLVHR